MSSVVSGHSFNTFIPLFFCFCIGELVFILRYMYGKPVQGHVNIMLHYYIHGAEDTLYEDKQVCNFI